MTLKEQFLHEVKRIGTPEIITVAVKLPNGAIEVITNTKETVSKALYYETAYDDDFKLKNNKEIQIVGAMVV